MNIQGRIVHEAAGAGRWYPAAASELAGMVERYIEAAGELDVEGRIEAAIAPHAGYVYSGAVAGYTWRALRDADAAGHVIDTVITLGFSHRHAFEGAIVMDGHALLTPLGEAQLDLDAARRLTHASSRLRLGFGPHHGEHSAENQIPFAQRALPRARHVIVLTGDRDPGTIEALVNAIAQLDPDRRLAVVASTDLLHDPDYEAVANTDRATLEHIAALDSEALRAAWEPGHQVCCGLAPVLVAMARARARGATGRLLHYCNSGDEYPASRGDWVVGYGAVVFHQPVQLNKESA